MHINYNLNHNFIEPLVLDNNSKVIIFKQIIDLDKI